MVWIKKIFISFDYDHDADAKLMLAGQAKHPDAPFDFVDGSVRDHLPGDWKEKANRAGYEVAELDW